MGEEPKDKACKHMFIYDNHLLLNPVVIITGIIKTRKTQKVQRVMESKIVTDFHQTTNFAHWVLFSAEFVFVTLSTEKKLSVCYQQ